MSEILFRIDLLNKRTGYDPELLKEMFNIFKDSYPEYFELLFDRIKDENWKGVSEIAHRAKSSVAIMGMETLREEFSKIEALGMNGEPIEGCYSWIGQLKMKVELAVNQIQKYVDGL